MMFSEVQEKICAGYSLNEWTLFNNYETETKVTTTDKH